MKNIHVTVSDELWGTTGNKLHHYHIVIVNVVFIDIHNVAVIVIAIKIIELYTSLFVSWASCQIREIAGAHAPGMPGMFSPSPQVSDPDMHHGTYVTHVPWCMPGSLTSGFLWNWRRGETFPAFPAHAQPAILRIWLEAGSGSGSGSGRIVSSPPGGVSR